MHKPGLLEAKRILAIRLDNIGDVIMLGPALRSLRHALPQAHITLMASPAGCQAAKLLPWVDKLIEWRPVWQDVSGTLPLDAGRELELVRRLHEGQFDAALIFTSFSQSPYPPAYVCYLAEIPIRIGQSKEFGGGVLTLEVKPPDDNGHQVDRNLNLIEKAGLPLAGRHLELAVPVAAQKQADRLLAQSSITPSVPFALMAPGASCAARRYDMERFAAVARLLPERLGLPVVISGNAREAELLKPVLDAADGSRVISLVGLTGIGEYAGLVRRSALVLTNNSSALHLADAFERPMVVLYSGTEYETQWQPRFSRYRLLRQPTWCSPCYQFRCAYHMECLDIAPEQVVTAAAELIAEQLFLTEEGATW